MGGRPSVQRRPADEIRVGLLRRHPPLEHDAARAGHDQPIAVPRGLRRVARHLAVRTMGLDESLKVGPQGDARDVFVFVTGATFSALSPRRGWRARAKPADGYSRFLYASVRRRKKSSSSRLVFSSDCCFWMMASSSRRYSTA